MNYIRFIGGVVGVIGVGSYREVWVSFIRERWGINGEERTTRLVPKEHTIRARHTRLEQAIEQTIRLEQARHTGLEQARHTRLEQAIEQTIRLEQARHTRLEQAIEHIGPVIIGANKIYE